MPDAELRADYDRDGRLSGSRSEYEARRSGLGAILGANVDHDGRALPPAPRVGSAVTLDFAMPAKSGRDDDLAPLEIVVTDAAAARFTSLRLRISGANADAVRLLDARGHVLTPESAAPSAADFALPRTAARHRFKLEASRVPGSPAGRTGGALELAIVGREETGRESIVDRGRFRLAPFVMLDELGPAQTLYMCSVPDNQPAVADVRAALRSVRPPVALRLVEATDNAGDAWIQDQFQLGYVRTPAGSMSAVLHLPRFRKNAQIGPTQRNLGELIRTHFPSTNLGLIDDLWNRDFMLRHLGGSDRLSFADSEEAFRILHRVENADAFLRSLVHRLRALAEARGLELPANTALPPQFETIPLKRIQLPPLLGIVERLVTALNRGVRESTEASRAGSDWVLSGRDRARAAVATVAHDLRTVNVNNQTFEMILSAGTFQLDSMQLIELYDELLPLHDSLGYGGNLEASPPLPGHPFGKIVVGEGEERPMDPALRALLDANADVQPLVTIDTTWLGVGHVDELIAFLPNRQEPGRHVIVRSSPEVAQALLQEVLALYRSGLEGSIRETEVGRWTPPKPIRHLMNLGAHPVTRMFRGRYWWHGHPQPRRTREGGIVETGEISEPPAIYLRSVDYFNLTWWSEAAPYFSGDRSQNDHYYRAALTTRELTYFKGTTNAEIVEEKLTPLDALLQSQFPEWPIRRLPVLFDRVPSLGIGSTSAFTPNLVNLQYLNGTVLVPNPFGPRMSSEDAATVVQSVLRGENLGGIAATATPAFFRRHHLDEVHVWLDRRMDDNSIDAPITTLTHIAQEFRDGWPHGTPIEEIESEIRRANRAAFNASGTLLEGWHSIMIPEVTVDVFQAYAQVILSALDLTVRWIDSWFYHVRAGEIHCGTNVLRAIPRTVAPWWTSIVPRGT
jgi:hypothetical protein